MKTYMLLLVLAVTAVPASALERGGGCMPFYHLFNHIKDRGGAVVTGTTPEGKATRTVSVSGLTCVEQVGSWRVPPSYQCRLEPGADQQAVYEVVLQGFDATSDAFEPGIRLKMFRDCGSLLACRVKANGDYECRVLNR